MNRACLKTWLQRKSQESTFYLGIWSGIVFTIIVFSSGNADALFLSSLYFLTNEPMDRLNRYCLTEKGKVFLVGVVGKGEQP